MNHADLAEKLFKSGYNCSQALFGAFCDVTGMDFETAVRVSSSFGGGMGRLREVCGGVTSAFAVAGMLWGYTAPADPVAKKEHYELIRDIASRFESINGTIICRELLKGIAEEKGGDPAERTDEYYAKRPCIRHIRECAEIMDRLIEERGIASK